MPLVSISSGALFAERLGSGPLRVLALHGWGRRGADFSASLGHIGTLALDLPGFGASPPPESVEGASGYAQLIEPVFEMFDEPPVVVGHSFGGRVAVARHAAFPGSFRGLVLAGVPLVRRSGPARKPALAYRMARLANRIGILSDEAMEQQKQKRGSDDYRAARGVMRDILVKVVNESYEQELEALDVPVRLLWGANDTEVPVSVAEQAEVIIRGAGAPVELTVLDGVGHHIPLQAPDQLRRSVDELLAQVDG